MNKQDRAQVDALKARLEAARGAYVSELEAIGSDLRSLADDEQAKFDNLSEGLQQSEQGQSIERAAEALATAADACESAEGQEAIDALDEIE